MKKILLINIAGIGDFVESISSLNAIRHAFTDAYISLVVSKKAYPYAKSCPYVNEVFALETSFSRGYNILSLSAIFRIISLSQYLRKQKFDIAMNLYELSTYPGAIRMAIFFVLTGAKTTIGRNTNGRGFFFDKKVDEQQNDNKSQTDYFYETIRVLNVKNIPGKTDLWYSAEDEKIADDLLNQCSITENDMIIGINPGSERTTRRWDSKYFAQVCHKLIETYKTKILIFGGPDDVKISKEISELTQEKCFNLARKTTIGSLVVLMKRLDLLISTNSAAMHIGGILNIPVVGIIGPGNPYRDRPSGDPEKIVLLWHKVKCNPCYNFECPKSGSKKMICMKKIGPEEIIKSVEHLLRRKN